MFTHFQKLCLLITFQTAISWFVIPTYQKTESAKNKTVWFLSSYFLNKETLILPLFFFIWNTAKKKFQTPNQNSNSLQNNAQ